MIAFRCLNCFTGNLSVNILSCPGCGGEEFAAQYFSQSLAKPYCHRIEQHKGCRGKSNNIRAETYSDVIKSSLSVRGQMSTMGRLFPFSQEASGYEIKRIKSERRRFENIGNTNLYSTHNELEQGQVPKNFNQEIIRKNRLLKDAEHTVGGYMRILKECNNAWNHSNFLLDSNRIQKPESKQMTSSREFSITVCKRQFESDAMLKNTEKSRYNSNRTKDLNVTPDRIPQHSILKSYKGNNTIDSPISPMSNYRNDFYRNPVSKELLCGIELSAVATHASNPQCVETTAQHEKSAYLSKLKYTFKCQKCKSRFKSELSLNVHGQTKCQMKLNECEKCSLVCSNKKELIHHFNMHIAEKRLKCNKCEYSSNFNQNLLQHIRKRHKG